MQRFLLLLPLVSASVPLDAQRPATRAVTDVSAPVTDVAYTVEFNKTLALRRTLRVSTSFSTPGQGEVLLSLPAWTPGAYELSWFARHVSAFQASGDGGKALVWDKTDFDTWRIRPAGSRRVTVSFEYHADSLDNAMAWSKDDFAFFNGTNVFLYPEGRDAAFSATVTVTTEPDWKVATGMTPTASPRRFTAGNLHDLLDMPFFVGVFDLDSSRVADRWVRLATYPAGKLAGEQRRTLSNQIERMFAPMIEVFGDTIHDSYTNLLVFEEEFDGGSALEHANSHLGIYTPLIIGNPVLPSITAHEIFHLWNVKRMRPAELVPYRYDRAQPTTLLWVSEGITDYYADLTLLRGGIIDSTQFLAVTHGKTQEVDAAPAVALEDASLSTWIHPADGTAYIYYPKGSLAGLLLDVMIRDASDNKSSLDVVMRDVYQRSFKQGKGFTTEDWWAAVSRAANGRSFADFNARHIDGREPFPYAQVLALAGLRVRTDSIREPRLGVFTAMDSTGVRVTATDAGSAAALAGVKPGDYLLSVGEVTVTEGFGERFRARYANAEGTSIPLKLTRDGQPLTLTMTVQMFVRSERQLTFDRTPTPRAARIRHGIFTGRRN
jgi:predicted metalloprotease with PDZ domain